MWESRLEGQPEGMADKVPLSYSVVSWSDRVYLLSEDEIVEFCNAINDGGEPRGRPHGFFFIRDEDWMKPVKGRPRLDPSYLSLLLDEPIRAAVLERSNDGLFRISAGKNQGLRVGMVLHVQGDSFASLKVISVDGDTSTCEAVYEEEVRVGEKLSTLFWDETLREIKPRENPTPPE